MKNKEIFENAVEKTQKDKTIDEKKQRVLKKYQEMFQPENIPNLDIDKFRKFFNFTENEHWTGLTQNISQLISDPKTLKEALVELLDETKPIDRRIDMVTGQSNDPIVKGLGPARISAILQIAYPDKYGVYNKVSVEGLKQIGMYPANSESSWNSTTLGKKYAAINDVLIHIAKEYKLTLWAMDWVWWYIISHENESSSKASEQNHAGGVSVHNEEPTVDDMIEASFSLESHLEDFLLENWDNTVLDREYNLEVLTDEETGEAIIGKQYMAGTRNRIDLLCRNRKTGGYTVIELKRGIASDTVVGQIQRYMGWVKQNLAKEKPVDGIVICSKIDEDLRYALLVTPNIHCLTYEISFKLNK